MSLRAHDEGDCWPDTCPFCRWEAEHDARPGDDDDEEAQR